MSKSKVRETEERLADLRLRTSIAATNYEVTSAFHLTPQQLEAQRNAAEFRALQAEEAAEVEAQRKNQPAFKLISQQWAKPIDALQSTSGLLPDVTAELPMTDKPVGNVQQTFENFLDLQKSRNIVYSSDGLARLVCYCEVMSRSSRVINGVTYRPASDTLDCWIAADRRLVELSAYGDMERAELIDEPQPEVTAELNANELAELASAEFSRLWGAVWEQWLVSLKTHFQFVPTEAQKIAALKYFERTNMGDPQVWNNCRIALSKSGVFPNLLTAEDILCLKMDGRDWDFSRADHRAEFARARNQTEFGTLD